jgi:hypothetical protein|tara:strand:- start:1919 stop:2209 length:291 start_codon:yes stop_codon:yes gene_type:complete
MESSVGSTDVGNVQVFTSNDRGHSPEEIAEMAVQRIFYISQEADPHIRDQVMAYREKIKGVIAEYMKKAIASDRTTLWNVLKKEGFHEEADIIRRL